MIYWWKVSTTHIFVVVFWRWWLQWRWWCLFSTFPQPAHSRLASCLYFNFCIWLGSQPAIDLMNRCFCRSGRLAWATFNAVQSIISIDDHSQLFFSPEPWHRIPKHATLIQNTRQLRSPALLPRPNQCQIHAFLLSSLQERSPVSTFKNSRW